MYDAAVQHIAQRVEGQDISAHVHHSDVSGQSGYHARVSRSTVSGRASQNPTFSQIEKSSVDIVVAIAQSPRVAPPRRHQGSAVSWEMGGQLVPKLMVRCSRALLDARRQEASFTCHVVAAIMIANGPGTSSWYRFFYLFWPLETQPLVQLTATMLVHLFHHISRAQYQDRCPLSCQFH